MHDRRPIPHQTYGQEENALLDAAAGRAPGAPRPPGGVASSSPPAPLALAAASPPPRRTANRLLAPPAAATSAPRVISWGAWRAVSASVGAPPHAPFSLRQAQEAQQGGLWKEFHLS
jgi:hypothetical protein